ncbi:MarR family winged helix-turn-helix transcriptional regulator [Agromyces seonyuensis]|uniref:MarR family transcriptional regulator n=1 Tax=Agromyces seonyuensis TaxID=2662446 RepID=A0A6I4P0S0_9MICO|nr:MarR family transcriptional regulator [Agromyces seonyuensis]MWB97609.1 MarR family transcriptional regulator [Agromyces seonyuensis]
MTDDARLDVDAAVATVIQDLGALFASVRVGWRDAAASVHPDLAPFGYQVLTNIETGKATTAGELVDRLRTDKSAVSRQLRQLESLDLVESRPDPTDRRARILSATPLAVERVRAARERYEASLGERLRHWSPEELAMFSELLARLR